MEYLIRRQSRQTPSILAAWRVAMVLAISLGVIPGMCHADSEITASKTATGFWTKYFDWTIDKSVDPTSILDLGQGETATVNYTIETVRTHAKDLYGVYGKICVTNLGSDATIGLAISDSVQTRLSGGPYTDYATRAVSTKKHPVLSPGEQWCYNYKVLFTPVPDALYRNVARVAVSNGAGTEAFADFTLPVSPKAVDTSAKVSDVLFCPPGFSCTPATVGPWTITGTATIVYATDITNISAECGTAYVLRNTASLKEKGHTRTDSTEVVITTKPCTPPPPSGCTLTQGYWKTHPEAWPVTALMLGTVSYTQAELLQILDQPVQGNGLVSLAHQLIATKLNSLNGASVPTSVANAMTDADTLIDGLVVPPIGSGSLPPADTSGITSTLDGYNNGLAEGGPQHCPS